MSELLREEGFVINETSGVTAEGRTAFLAATHADDASADGGRG